MSVNQRQRDDDDEEASVSGGCHHREHEAFRNVAFDKRISPST